MVQLPVSKPGWRLPLELNAAQQAETHLQANPSRLIWNILAWMLTILLAITFTSAGGVKLLNNPAMVQEFAQVGLGQWFRYFTGILEVSGAIGLLIPRVRFWAALEIATVMVGATIANLTVLHLPALAGLTAVLLGLALALAWLRRPQPGRE
jgi:putative oxidoreductase